MIPKRRKNEEVIKSEEQKLESQVVAIPEPKICLFDFSDDQANKIRARGFNILLASLGSPVLISNESAPYRTTFCLSNHYTPSNLHELDILVFDLSEKKPIPYRERDHSYKEQKDKVAWYFLSKYPQTVFDPRAYAGSSISPLLDDFLNKRSIVIVFAAKREEIGYTFATLDDRGYEVVGVKSHNTFSFMDIRFLKNLSGSEIRIDTEHAGLRSILERFIGSLHYEVVFFHPSVRGQQDTSFIPIMRNKQGDIIGYLEVREDSLVLVFPPPEDKATFLLSLLEEFLPEFLPDLFPFSTTFSWKKASEYSLPNQKALLETRRSIEEDYRIKLNEIDDKINRNADEYSFLHDLISETGEKLVDAVKTYLEWVGFTDVIKMDSDEKIKEEDLQVRLDNGLLVIEVKGIGGTSKDSDCSQINKIKHRRAKERGKFDVYGLYIVNHQRYLPPKTRKNPPFTEAQIFDSRNEERGLLTTWDLFKGYDYVLNGIITKEDVRKWILDYGLVQLAPKVLLGKVSEVFKQGFVIILNIESQRIKVGETIYIYQEENYSVAKIVEIRVNDVSIIEVDAGEVGIEVDIPVKKNSLIYRKE